MTTQRRIWIEEPGVFGSVIVCDFCDGGAGRNFGPIPERESRRWAEVHAFAHANAAGVVPHVYDEADLVCIEAECWRRRHHADGRCRACWVRVKRAAARALEAVAA